MLFCNYGEWVSLFSLPFVQWKAHPDVSSNASAFARPIATVFKGMIFIAFSSSVFIDDEQTAAQLVFTDDLHMYQSVNVPPSSLRCFALFTFNEQLYAVFRGRSLLADQELQCAIFQLHDLTGGTWVEITNGIFPNKCLGFNAWVIAANKLWIIGGWKSYQAPNAVLVFDLIESHWKDDDYCQCLPEFYSSDLSAVANDRFIHLMGSVSSSTVPRFNPQLQGRVVSMPTNESGRSTWMTNVVVPQPPQTSEGFAAIDGVLVMAGGKEKRVSNGRVFCHTSAHDDWVELPSLRLHCQLMQLLKFGDQLVAIGFVNKPGDPERRICAVQALDLSLLDVSAPSTASDWDSLRLSSYASILTRNSTTANASREGFTSRQENTFLTTVMYSSGWNQNRPYLSFFQIILLPKLQPSCNNSGGLKRFKFAFSTDAGMH